VCRGSARTWAQHRCPRASCRRLSGPRSSPTPAPARRGHPWNPRATESTPGRSARSAWKPARPPPRARFSFCACATAPPLAVHEPPCSPSGQRHLAVFDPAASAPDPRVVRLPLPDSVVGRVEGAGRPPDLGRDRVVPPVWPAAGLGFGLGWSTGEKRGW
jgi:hypothetical protein